MFVTFKNFAEQKVCIETFSVKHEHGHLTFNCKETGSKFMVDIESLLSIKEYPDMLRIAFIPRPTWFTIKDDGRLSGKDIRWHKDYLYCWENNVKFLQAFLKENVDDDEVVVEQEPELNYEYANRTW